MLPVNVFGPRTPPPPFKQLRVHPDGGMGPIPLYTGWTLGPVPNHVAAWALAAKRSSADLDSSTYGGRPRSGTGGGEGGGVAELAEAVAAGAEDAAAAAERGDALLASITAAQPGARLPLVPEPDETFKSRDTCITGRSRSPGNRLGRFGWLSSRWWRGVALPFPSKCSVPVPPKTVACAHRNILLTDPCALVYSCSIRKSCRWTKGTFFACHSPRHVLIQ